ncbi:MAG: hypothetical protein FD138_1747 [Planctomycetota bacterium]|nr:MAG: hypothetical protein FD138_1747 [Planctomycetota bacterium]
MDWGFIVFLTQFAIAVLIPAVIWGVASCLLALIEELSFWGELRKLPSHSMDVPIDLSPSDCRIRNSQGPVTTMTSTGPFVWIVEDGLILKHERWMVRLAGRILGTLRIARSCCKIHRSYTDRVIIWMQVGPPARPSFRVGVEILRGDLNPEQLALLDRWAAETAERQTQAVAGANAPKT